jgi:hypothetical protein
MAQYFFHLINDITVEDLVGESSIFPPRREVTL